jgi:hypothetical protein
MFFARSSPALRSAARRAFSAPRQATRNAVRNVQTKAEHPQGGSSDLPWIIASVGITIPAVSIWLHTNDQTCGYSR